MLSTRPLDPELALVAEFADSNLTIVAGGRLIVNVGNVCLSGKKYNVRRTVVESDAISHERSKMAMPRRSEWT